MVRTQFASGFVKRSVKIALLCSIAAVYLSAIAAAAHPNKNGTSEDDHEGHNHNHAPSMMMNPFKACDIQCPPPPKPPGAEKGGEQQQKCRDCMMKCDDSTSPSDKQRQRNETRACMQLAATDVVMQSADTNCIEAFTCIGKCMKVIFMDKKPDGQKTGEKMGDEAKECITSACPNFCTAARGCVDSKTGQNQACALTEKAHRTGRDECPEPCRTKCKADGSCNGKM